MAALRVGLVGYGMAGRDIHSPLLRQTGDRVVGVVTRNPGRAAAATADWPGVVVHEDLPGLLGQDLDVVVIVSPTGRHLEHTRAALAAGAPVVVDKPLAVTARDAQELVDLAEQDAGRLTVFHNRRWDAEQLTAAALVASGVLGTVHGFERRWERWRPVPKDRWRENAADDGGGLLLDLGAHLVDSAVQLFGPVASVYAEIRSLTTPADDDVLLSLHHHSGTVSHLGAGSLVGAPGPRTRVLGSAGAYLVTSFENEPTPFAVLDELAGVEHCGWLVHGDRREPVPRAAGEHADFYRGVRSWLRDGGPAPVDPRDAVRTARVLDVARVAAAEGRRLAVD